MKRIISILIVILILALVIAGTTSARSRAGGNIVLTPDFHYVLTVNCLDGGTNVVDFDNTVPHGGRVYIRCLPFRPE